MTFDFNNYNPDQHYVPELPKGITVRGIIKKAAWYEKQESFDKDFRIAVEVHEPVEFKGAVISKSFSLVNGNEQVVEIAKKELANLYKVLNLKQGANPERDAVDQPITLFNGTRNGKDGKTYSDVKIVMPRAETAPPAADDDRAF